MKLFFQIITALLIIALSSQEASSQRLFPVKVNKKWGLINSDGRLVTDADYDAIGEFKNFGLATMQRNGKVGLLNLEAKEVIPPVYQDLVVLNSELVNVRQHNQWKVINMSGTTVLPPGYDQVDVWPGNVLGFKKKNKWGMVDFAGNSLSDAVFDKIEATADGRYYITSLDEKVGVLRNDGYEILPPEYDDIKIMHPELVLFKIEDNWGAVNKNGAVTAPCVFDAFQQLAPGFIKCYEGSKVFLYSIASENIITSQHFENFYPFSDSAVLVKKHRLLGLIDVCGEWILRPVFNEIQRYGKDYFRVNKGGQWGIITAGGAIIIPFEYQYIAPLRGKFCVVRKSDAFGVCNYHGELVVDAAFSKIEFGDNQIKAYEGEALSLFDFDNDARLLENSEFEEHFTITIGTQPASPKKPIRYETDFVLQSFEWFYSPANDKWGLRRLSDGTTQIEPLFDYVKVDRAVGLSIVGVRKQTKYTFDQTTYRFEMVYGLVNNDTGGLITDVDYWHFDLKNFKEGKPLARFIQKGGKFGLMLKTGTIILKDCAFIGSFVNGYARISLKGRLSGHLPPEPLGLEPLEDFLSRMIAPNRMTDFTHYDQRFNREAMLTCSDCIWGYVDTLGRMAVMPQYNFAFDFINEVGIVKKDNKWGAVNGHSKTLIPFEFDDIHFLENTNNKIIRIYKKEPKYGLIDTSGQIRVNVVFDEIGSFSEGKLAVRRNQFWGFVNRNGQEIVPCRFDKVKNFSEGLVAVKMGNHWGYSDGWGEVVIKPEFRRVGAFNYGLAWAFNSQGCIFINREGKQAFDKVFQKSYDFQFGVARIVEEGKYGLIDKNGNYVIRPDYTDISPFNQYGLAVARYGSDNIRYGILNIRGELITDLDFREIRDFKNGMAAVKYRDGYGFIDRKGDLVVPAQFSKVSDFSEGFAAVQLKGQCGYIDKKGEWLIKPQFSKCLDFKEGKAVVYRGLKNAGLIDIFGQVLIKPEINRLLDFSDGRGLVRDSSYRFYYITEQAKVYDGYYQKAGEFKFGVAVVQMNDKWGIINQKGLEITPPKYDKISQFENGYAKVRIKGFSGLTNTRGEAIVQPDYEYISYAGEGLFRVEQGDKVGYFDEDGNWVWNLSE